MKTPRLGCALALAVACAGNQNLGSIVVVAQAATAAPQITHVRVTITPAAVARDLTVDSADPTRFTGSFSVPVGTQILSVEAFSAGEKSVGTGTATVAVQKNATVQAQIRILDLTGPATGPDHSPVVTSLVTPAAAQVDDQLPLNATAMDADQDPMTFLWTESPSGCGLFANRAAAATTFTAKLPGTCTVTFTVTANGKSDGKSAPIAIAAGTGSIDVVVTYVPQPVISSIAFSSGTTTLATVARNAADATLRVPFHKGTAYTVTFSFDPWSTGTNALSDSCGGTIVQPAFVANATSARATWTPTVDTGACVIVATVTRETLTDSLFVVALPVP
jgi:hypothetical protein